jgi:hypothetical protein
MPLQQGGYLPDPAVPLLMEQFNGLNTSTTRAGVPDDQCYFIDGLIPLDHHNLRTLYDVGTTLYTATGTTIVFFYFVNITSIPYCIIFLANGSVAAVNMLTNTSQTILPAGTILTPSQLSIGISQWGQQYIIIVSNQANGYWVWDGTAIYQSGSIGPSVSLTNNGSGYISQPVITLVGGSGFGAVFTSSISNGSIVSVQVVNPGQGYQAGDTPTLVFTGGNTSGSGASINAILAHHAGGTGASIAITLVFAPATGQYLSYATLQSGGSGYSNIGVQVNVSGGSPAAITPITTSVTLGVISSIGTNDGRGPGWFGTYNTSVVPTASVVDNGYFFINSTSIVNGGSNYSNFPVLTVVDATASITASPVLRASVTQPGGSITSVSIVAAGQFGVSVTPTVVITDTATTAAGTVTLMPYGVSGNAVETYSGHVWVVNKNLIQFSAPGSVSDFSTADGGGSQQSNSSYLKIGYTRLIQSNGFLFLIADSSIDYISGVQTSGMSPTTTYTLQNASPTIGTPYPWSVILRGQDLIMANSLGIYVVAGSQPTKISQMLDGFWGTVPNFGGLNLSSAHANIFSREVWMTLAEFVNPVTTATVTQPCMWDGGKRWFTSPQNMSMTYIASQEINSVFTTYGTNGTIVAPLFSVPSTNFTKTVQSKLWGEPGGAMITKMPDRFWAIADYYSVTSPAITATLDAVQVDPVSGTVNNTAVTYTLAGPTAPLHYVTAPQAIGQQGVLIGMTIKTNCNDMALVSVLTDQKPAEYRG